MDALDAHDIALVRADNPGPFSLTGTNTWLVGSDPCWIVDPGPLLPGHQAAVAAAARSRGGAAGIALTHDHADHVGGHEALLELLSEDGEVPLVGAVRHPADVTLRDGDAFGPLSVVATPGHAPDHVAFVTETGALLSGDAVLGTGSVFVSPSPGALVGYLAALRGLRARDLSILCPGHGPVVERAHAKLDEYLEHRLERERLLVAALADGRRTIDELLDAAWSDAPEALRPAAAVTMAAHLDKLDEEGGLPDGVERPEIPAWLAGVI